MSIQHVARVLDARDPKVIKTRKLVLMALANRADDKGKCWPSQKLIAEECGIDPRSLRDHLKGLDSDGFLTRKTQHLGKGNGSRTTYTLHLDRLKVASEKTSAPEVAPEVFDTCAGSSPPITNLQEPTLSNTDVFDLTRDAHDPLDDALKAYQAVANRLRLENAGNAVWPRVVDFTPKRRAALKSRIDKHGLQAWGEVLRKAANSPHCLGHNNRGWTASFDFLTSPSGFTKTLEGNYDDRTPASNNLNGNSAHHRGGAAQGGLSFEAVAARLEGDAERPVDPAWDVVTTIEGDYRPAKTA